MSALVLPYFDFAVECPGCNFGCNVRIWNGVNAFEMAPAMGDYAKANTIVSICATRFDFAQSAIAHAFQDGPHVHDFVLLWAEDQKTFDLLVKLAKNYHNLTELDDGDEDDDDHHRRDH